VEVAVEHRTGDPVEVGVRPVGPADGMRRLGHGRPWRLADLHGGSRECRLDGDRWRGQLADDCELVLVVLDVLRGDCHGTARCGLAERGLVEPRRGDEHELRVVAVAQSPSESLPAQREHAHGEIGQLLLDETERLVARPETPAADDEQTS